MRIPFPFWDMIGIEAYLDGHPSPSIFDLYRDIRDNEHRPIVSFLFYILDRNVFGDSGALLYPAIFISEYKPVEVLKGQLRSGNSASLFRKVLVIIQFALSIILIISTVVVFRQMNYMENKDIGFVRENLFYVWMQGDMSQKFESVRNQILVRPGIESVTASSQLPIEIGNSTSGLVWEGKDPEERILFANLNVDYEFIETMKTYYVLIK